MEREARAGTAGHDGPLSPVSSSDEMPDANLLSRQKRQLAAAQRRRSSQGNFTAGRTSFSNRDLRAGDQNGPPMELKSEQLVPRSEFGGRRLSWRESRAQFDGCSEGSHDKLEMKSPEIPAADWTKQSRPSWRRTSAEHEQLSGADTLQPPQLESDSAALVSQATVLESKPAVRNIPQLAAEAILTEVLEVQGLSHQVEEEQLEAGVPQRDVIASGETMVEGVSRVLPEIGQRQFPECVEKVLIASGDLRSSTNPGCATPSAFQTKKQPVTRAEKAPVVVASERTSSGSGVRKENLGGSAVVERMGGGSARKRTSSIAELKKLAVVGVKSRRQSASDVTGQELSSEERRTEVEKLRRQSEGDVREQSDMRSLDEPALEKGSQANAAASAVQGGVETPASTALRSPPEKEALSPVQTELAAENEEEQEKMIVEKEREEDNREKEIGVRKKARRRTSADMLKGDWLAKAREIGAHQSIARETSGKVARAHEVGGKEDQLGREDETGARRDLVPGFSRGLAGEDRDQRGESRVGNQGQEQEMEAAMKVVDMARKGGVEWKDTSKTEGKQEMREESEEGWMREQKAESREQKLVGGERREEASMGTRGGGVAGVIRQQVCWNVRVLLSVSLFLFSFLSFSSLKEEILCSHARSTEGETSNIREDEFNL